MQSEESAMSQITSRANFAETFERVVVPAIFVPWGHDLLERARPIGPSERVLDLGCGTGIVARLLRERLGGGTRITGLDVSEDMLAVARRVAPELEWRQGSATAMPLEDASFDLVLSQQMLQFVPDRAAVAREARRVLAPGGRVFASVWRGVADQPLWSAVTAVGERHLGPSRDPRFAWGDADALASLFRDAGFEDVRVEVVSRADVAPDVLLRLNLMPMGFDLSAFSDEERERRLAAVEAECAPLVERYAVDGGYAVPLSANVVSAVAP